MFSLYMYTVLVVKNQVNYKARPKSHSKSLCIYTHMLCCPSIDLPLYMYAKVTYKQGSSLLCVQAKEIWDCGQV